jgi:hypothetical protein
MEKKIKEVCDIPDHILAKLQSDVAEIKVALLGNEYNPAGGLLCRTSEVEKELEKLRNRYDKMIWAAGGAGAAISFIVSILVFIFDKIILK